MSIYCTPYSTICYYSWALFWTIVCRAAGICVHMHENKTHLSAVVLTLLHIHCIKRALAAHHHKMNQKNNRHDDICARALYKTDDWSVCTLCPARIYANYCRLTVITAMSMHVNVWKRQRLLHADNLCSMWLLPQSTMLWDAWTVFVCLLSVGCISTFFVAAR